MAFVAQAILAFTGLSCEFPIQVTSSNENSDETWFWMAPVTKPFQQNGVRSRFEDKRLSMRVLYCQGKQAQKQTERTPESVDHDSPPEISFIGKREKSGVKTPRT